MKSVLQKEKYCYLCAKLEGFEWNTRDLEEHHIFYGPFRTASERHGLKVWLCRRHHKGDHTGTKDAVHNNMDKRMDIFLKKKAQQKWEEIHSEYPGTEEAHQDFREIFGKNCL